MIKLIEKSMIGKKNQIDCEDGYFISDKLVAVVDGGTPKGKIKWKNNKTSGWFAKELILKAFKTVDPNWSNKKIIEHINHALNLEYKNKEKFFYEHPEEQLQAGVVYYNDVSKEVVSYGDCPILINNKLYDHGKFIDLISTGLRSFYLRLVDLKAIKISKEKRNEFGRQVILDFLTKQSFFANLERPFGFPVINGLKLNHKLTIVHKVKKADEIVLASDGYIKLKNTLKASEKYLKDYLFIDPECYKDFLAAKGKNKNFKSFDDRTYLRLKIIE
ncbi:hypothetical protein [Mycoplasmoides pirum]|uniref:hypothetical protein n=1 Tax=Mycoplasmoides pirum TaxID=2122 RepID=UPI000482A777|nr:hypothetical protein [Mycoplasmoides pirum]